MADGDDLNSSVYQSALRKREYKHLLEAGAQAAENIDSLSVADNLITLKDILTKSNELISQGQLTDRIGQSAEVVLDAQVCKLASDLMGSTVQKIENDEFSDENYVAALMGMVLDENNVNDWTKLDNYAAKMSKTFDSQPSMFGTFDFEAVASGSQATQKQRKAARRKADPVEEKRPVAVTQPETADAGKPKVEIVYNTIKKVYRKNGGKPIPYFQLVIDPTNMMYTFDNTFQVSFLFRDGLIAFVKDDEGLPAIKPMDENNRAPKPVEMASFTSSLDGRLIKKYIDKYNIVEPMLKIDRSD